MKRLLLVCLFLLTACAPTLKVEQYGQGIQEIREDEFPRQVAILPFVNETAEPGLDAMVRRNFANHFSSKNYVDVKLPVIDEKLVRLEKSSGKIVRELPALELSAAIGIDGLLYGKVTDYIFVYAGVYSQLGIEAEVWLVNGKTGKELFRQRESVRYHEGGIPTSPLAAVVTAVSTAMNLREIQKVRLVNELAYKFMGKLPSPRTMSAENRPQIREVLTNAGEGPFGPRRVIKAGMQGDPGLVATFDIGSFKRGVPMKELQPGIYSGEYAVLPGDGCRDMPVTVTLTRPGGLESQWLDPTGYITIDTIAPPAVSGVKAKGKVDAVELVWQAVQSSPDLKGYRVQRSESPLSGYRELTFTEQALFSDSTAQVGTQYFYRVIAVDRAGNDSETGETVRGALASAQPRQLSGELTADTVIDGEAQVTTPLLVPRGVTLTFASGARTRFADNAGLTILGKLVAHGGDATVEFVPAGKEIWPGITVDGGQVAVNRLRITRASTGFDLKNAEGSIGDAIISGCRIGMALTGVTPVTVSGTTVSGNDTGLSLTRTASRFSGGNIIQNRTGIIADSFSGELLDNNILDNEVNISAKQPFTLGPNWFGTTNIEDMKLSGVAPLKVYDALLPGGKLVEPVRNPYAGLNRDERLKKSAELMIEAGGYFRQRNFGKAASLFAEQLKVVPTADTYYYLSLCHQEMKEKERSLAILREGTGKFSQDALLWKSLGMLACEKGDEATARSALTEALRLSPDDRQARFVLDRLVKPSDDPPTAPSLQLLTDEEAALPNSRKAGFTELPAEGPEISADNVEITDRKPFRLAISFKPKAGEGADISSLRVTGLKVTPIDLTPRIKPFVSEAGLFIRNVILPEGQHRFRVSIADYRGRLSEKEFVINVKYSF
ncbi:hypothetical protein OR1_01751 [Geobacter sp. OR-1]|uniref:GNA1162 family protein n=1 Tax=Geobacter sp. OR-1 TaxID=1266765 RepID=UPI00054257E1|nr:GNA1162 family protein [Geobacter sp. OR-1]GAM09472.1 hypothetical protein OR1_01751 [Geobacter sp. OR-1]